MTVIDYLPVGEEVRPNVLLCQTKKCIISKVMACITVFLLRVHSDKQQNNSTERRPLACSAECTNNGIKSVFVMTVFFCHGPLRAGVSERAVHLP